MSYFYINYEEDFEENKNLGSGSYGSVYLMTHKPTGVQYAVKVFDKDRSFNFTSETRKLMSIDHPCIVKFHFLIMKNDSTFSISMEYAPNGTIRQKLLSKQNFTPTEKSIIALGISYGLQELHSRNILHLDLKPGNVLLNKDNYPLICDFGFCAKPEELEDYNGFITPGSFPYIPPEIINCEDLSKADASVDIFAFGVILYNLLTGKQMFAKDYKNPLPRSDIIEKYNNDERPSLEKYQKDDKKICDLIEKCWQTDPNKRPNIEEVTQYLSRIENVFNKTEKQPFFEYIEFVNKKLEENLKNIVSRDEISERIDEEFAMRTLEISKNQPNSARSRRLLEISLSTNSKYRNDIVQSSISSYFSEKKLSQEELEKARSFFMSKSQILKGEEFLKIGDKFRDFDSDFAWDFYDLSIEKGCEEGRKRIQKFLTFKNLNLSFDRFVRYSIQNADYINEQNKFSLDVEQEMNCLFIAKNYIDYNISHRLQNKSLKEISSTSSIESSTNSIDTNSVENDDSDDEDFDVEKIESKYDDWIEILSNENYEKSRKEFYSNIESKHQKLSDEYYEEMAESGCPNCACIATIKKKSAIKKNLIMANTKTLKEQFLHFAELSIINGSKKYIDEFTNELNRGEFIKKDVPRANRLIFFKNLEQQKPIPKPDLFKYESFFVKKVEKDKKQNNSKKTETNIQLDDDDDSYYYSEEEVEEVKVVKKSADSVLKKEKNKKEDKKIKLIKSTPRLMTQKKRGKGGKKK